MVILDDQAKCVGQASGKGTNPWVSIDDTYNKHLLMH